MSAGPLSRECFGRGFLHCRLPVCSPMSSMKRSCFPELQQDNGRSSALLTCFFTSCANLCGAMRSQPRSSALPPRFAMAGHLGEMRRGNKESRWSRKLRISYRPVVVSPVTVFPRVVSPVTPVSAPVPAPVVTPGVVFTVSLSRSPPPKTVMRISNNKMPILTIIHVLLFAARVSPIGLA